MDLFHDDSRWAAVSARDPEADGTFVYAVQTTGVYCRPSCAARPRRENVRFFPDQPAARRAGFRPCRRCHPDDDLTERGYEVWPSLISRTAAQELADLYVDPTRFRSRVVMARHGFGQGEYQYFAYPLPESLASLRSSLYARLTPLANRWNHAMGFNERFPPTHSEFVARCHEAGQLRPTPLLLRYEEGDFNCLHQDLYGEHVFPLQVAILLSEPGRDFTGGEFVLTEQRPRQQSRVEVVPLSQGDAVVFAVHHRPRVGVRGLHRVVLRHGVSRVRSGRRFAAGLIFHDAT